MNQREAVYKATMSVLSDAGINFEKGMNVTSIMTQDLRKRICAIVTSGFKSGVVELKDSPANSEKRSDDSKLNAYVIGLVNNWHRKDKELNGGEAYTPKNPGSRTGLQDQQLIALRAVKAQFKDQPEKLAKIQEAIEHRISVLKAGKATKISFNSADLPAELATELGIDQTQSE